VNEDRIIDTAKQMRESLGGTIFSFPTEPDNPFSPYAIVVYAGERYFVYPEATDISTAAVGVLTILDEFKKNGIDADYDRNVRLVSCQPQVDAPSTVMKRLKKENHFTPHFLEGKDYMKGTDGEEELISARGLLKLSYIQAVEEKNPKAIQFMSEYYKLLATRRYGKTAAAIKQEVNKMGKGQAFRWLEQTFEKYIKDDMEVMDLLNRLG
jgi:hypothetical protein